MNESERFDKTTDLIKYLRKKPNALVDDTMREHLDHLSDADFSRAVSRLLRESVKFSMDVDRFLEVVSEVTAPEIARPWLSAEEIKCDCCGYVYKWSVVGADVKISAERNWWYDCPLCGFDGYIQHEVHREITRTGKEPEGYRAMLDRQWKGWESRDFQPRTSQNRLKEELAKGTQISRKEWEQAQRLIMSLEESHVERRKRTGARIIQFPNRAAVL
ncbi:MAG: hypothetical protein LBS86_00845 [Treponema sp.]|jgi:hypothetical protein|nr:hypothetical protein [Treponema sp.]